METTIIGHIGIIGYIHWGFIGVMYGFYRESTGKICVPCGLHSEYTVNASCHELHEPNESF